MEAKRAFKWTDVPAPGYIEAYFKDAGGTVRFISNGAIIYDVVGRLLLHLDDI